MLLTYLVYNTDRCYDRKKSSSRKKKVLVICLAGARLLLQPEKKVLVVCLARVHERYYDRKKSSSQDFYAKLNVSNLNVTNLY